MQLFLLLAMLPCCPISVFMDLVFAQLKSYHCALLRSFPPPFHSQNTSHEAGWWSAVCAQTIPTDARSGGSSWNTDSER